MIYLSKYQDNPAPEPVETEESFSMSPERNRCRVGEGFRKKNNLGKINLFLITRGLKMGSGLRTLLHKSVIFAIVFVMVNLFFVSVASGQTTYYLKTASIASANVVTSWNTDPTGGGAGTDASAFTGSSDTWVILNTQQAATFANGTSTTFAGTLQVDGTLTVASSSVSSSTTVTTGTVLFSVAGSSQVTITSASGAYTNTFALSPSGTLKTNNTAGVFGTNCSIASIGIKAVVTLPTTANYEFNGVGQSTLGLPATVNNLTLSGSGAKTLQTGTTTISGNLTLSGTATATTVVGLTISGNLVVGDGTTF
ncbi:MAG: hypothetical protein WC865_17895, partial [Bacteroidales bacterium]